MANDSTKDYPNAELVWINPFSGETGYLGQLVEERDDIQIGRKVVKFKRRIYIPFFSNLLAAIEEIISSVFGQEKTFIIDREENFRSNIMWNLKTQFIDSLGLEHTIIPVDVSMVKNINNELPPYMVFGAMKNLLSSESDNAQTISELKKKLSDINKEMPFLMARSEKVADLEVELERTKKTMEIAKVEATNAKLELGRWKRFGGELTFIMDSSEDLASVMSEVRGLAELHRLQGDSIEDLRSENKARADFLTAKKLEIERKDKDVISKKEAEEMLRKVEGKRE